VICSLGPTVVRLLALLQAAAGLRVVERLVRTAWGERIQPVDPDRVSPAVVSVLLPVLNEARRLGPCLDGLRSQGKEVAEILVIDGGSEDRTPALAQEHARQDPRIRLIDARPVPSDWNGKAWGLHVGSRCSRPDCPWLLTIDADVRPRPGLVAALLDQAERAGVAALSVATAQELAGPGDGLLHPALLTTLVYRWGIPGQATDSPRRARANGQCMLIRRAALEGIGGFAAVRRSLCEDVTLAQLLAREGQVGFYEAPGLVSVQMYSGWTETLTNWPRSLTLRDHLSRWRVIGALIALTLTQGLPLLLVVLLTSRRQVSGPRRLLIGVNCALIALRMGVLVGMARAYPVRPPTYWLSPLADGLAVAALWASMLRRRHAWRGRVIPGGGT
jgi:dolichol-phosphate mannosyltransferase